MLRLVNSHPRLNQGSWVSQIFSHLQFALMQMLQFREKFRHEDYSIFSNLLTGQNNAFGDSQSGNFLIFLNFNLTLSCHGNQDFPEKNKFQSVLLKITINLCKYQYVYNATCQMSLQSYYIEFLHCLKVMHQNLNKISLLKWLNGLWRKDVKRHYRKVSSEIFFLVIVFFGLINLINL